MSGYTNLLLRLQEVERALADAVPAALSAFQYSEEDRHSPSTANDCRHLMFRLDEAQFNLAQALRHLEEEDHA